MHFRSRMKFLLFAFKIKYLEKNSDLLIKIRKLFPYFYSFHFSFEAVVVGTLITNLPRENDSVSNNRNTLRILQNPQGIQEIVGEAENSNNSITETMNVHFHERKFRQSGSILFELSSETPCFKILQILFLPFVTCLSLMMNLISAIFVNLKYLKRNTDLLDKIKVFLFRLQLPYFIGGFFFFF